VAKRRRRHLLLPGGQARGEFAKSERRRHARKNTQAPSRLERPREISRIRQRAQHRGWVQEGLPKQIQPFGRRRGGRGQRVTANADSGSRSDHAVPYFSWPKDRAQPIKIEDDDHASFGHAHLARVNNCLFRLVYSNGQVTSINFENLSNEYANDPETETKYAGCGQWDYTYPDVCDRLQLGFFSTTPHRLYILPPDSIGNAVLRCTYRPRYVSLVRAVVLRHGRRRPFLARASRVEPSLDVTDEVSSDNGAGRVFDRYISSVVNLAKDRCVSVIGLAIAELGKGGTVGGDSGSNRACAVFLL
jgi:hypothetical protein